MLRCLCHHLGYLLIIFWTLTQAQAALKRKVHVKHNRVIHNGDPNGVYPIAAFRDTIKHTVRIYGQYPPGLMGGSPELESQFSGCSMSSIDGRHELVSGKDKALIWYGSDHEFNNYYVDCEDPGDWATGVAIELQNGHLLGDYIEIERIGTTQKGKLAVCSQPLHTNRDWLEDWVDHYLMIGASKIILHAPQGQQIDDLFNENRTQRIKLNGKLAERSPDVVGKEPLKRFTKPLNPNNGEPQVQWVDYWPSPQAVYYAEEFVFVTCHYRLRYEYEYVTQFDIDEFFYMDRVIDPKFVYMPAVLDKFFPPEAPALAIWQKNFPRECRSRNTSTYAADFSLGYDILNQPKAVVRPLAVERMHVHFMMDASPEWREKYSEWEWARTITEIPSSVAYLKHIRPFFWFDEDGVETHILCSFGEGADQNYLGSGLSVLS